MEAFAPALLIVAALLVVAGAPKVARPEAAARALAGVGLPGHPVLVRLLGAGEVGIGLAAIAVGGPLSALAVGLAYLGFAVFVAYALGRGGASCGCLGSSETPPTGLHLALNIVAACVGLLAATSAPAGLLALLADQPAAGIPMVGFLALATWFLYLVLAELPQLVHGGTQ